jgi:hypothetical protein
LRESPNSADAVPANQQVGARRRLKVIGSNHPIGESAQWNIEIAKS